jgi:DNA-binding winged helix-turn-helix (wHTH) protein/tetratricopeptide (TPR) repeat protein
VQDTPTICFGPYVFEPHQARLRRGTRVLPLTRKACAVLQYLVTHPGQLVTKDALLAAVWPETVVSEGVLTNCIAELRQALGDQAQRPRYIATVHRQGYRFIAPLSLPAPAASDVAAPDAKALAPPRAAPAPGPPLLVGREAELASVQCLYTQALHGQRQVVFVTGEAGIGKTALVEAVVHGLRSEDELWLGHGQCIEQYGAGEAYLPLLEALGRLGRGPGGERLVALLAQHAPSWMMQLPALLPAHTLADLRHTLAGTTHARMLRELAEGLEALSAERPLVLVLEDLHWSDPSTVEALALLARRRDPARLLVLGTYRPVDLIVHDHPLKQVARELAAHGQCVEVALRELSAPAVAAYVAQRGVAPEARAEVTALVYRRTEGHPLFMVQLLDYLAQHDVLQTPTKAAALLLDEAVPQGLRQLLEAQLERLAAEEQRVLEAGSVAGVEFGVASVAAGLETTPEAVEAVCDRLARQGQFLEERGLAAWPDGTVSGRYGFRHALYQAVVYQRLSAGRRAGMHRLVGARQEVGYGTQAPEVAAELAVHFERGHDPARAVRYRQQAAAQALERYAYPEAVDHLTRGLALLQTLPETPERARHELALQMALAPALLARHGASAPVVEQAYVRLRDLCQHVGEPAPLSAALLGLASCQIVRGRLRTARALLQQALSCAPEAPTTADHGQAHVLLGSTAFFLGEFATARAHLEQSLALYAPPRYFRGSASRSFRLIRLAEVLWHLGYPDHARHCCDEALGLSQAEERPVETAVTFIFAARLHRYRREPRHTLGYAEQALTLYHEQLSASRLTPARSLQVGPSFGAYTAVDPTLRLTQARILQGWARVMHGQEETGLVQIQDGIRTYRAHGAVTSATHYLVLLAEAYGHLGDPATGLQVLAEAHAALAASEERYQEAELYRLQGDLVWQCAACRPRATGASGPSPRHQPPLDTAVACFDQALALARQQGAKSLELRAALSLSRLWQCQGKRADAYALLTPLYDWFTEGFDTADLQEAKALLEALA